MPRPKKRMEIADWPDKPHFTEAELAVLADVSTKTLWRLRRDGEIGYRRVGKHIIYTRADWEEYLRNSRRMPLAYAADPALHRPV